LQGRKLELLHVASDANPSAGGIYGERSVRTKNSCFAEAGYPRDERKCTSLIHVSQVPSALFASGLPDQLFIHSFNQAPDVDPQLVVRKRNWLKAKPPGKHSVDKRVLWGRVDKPREVNAHRVNAPAARDDNFASVWKHETSPFFDNLNFFV
jgi:hypothetical protein